VVVLQYSCTSTNYGVLQELPVATVVGILPVVLLYSEYLEILNTVIVFVRLSVCGSGDSKGFTRNQDQPTPDAV
jgi:hypothetical protein